MSVSIASSKASVDGILGLVSHLEKSAFPTMLSSLQFVKWLLHACFMGFTYDLEVPASRRHR